MPDPAMRPNRLVTRAVQKYWRMSRGLTLGAQGVVIDGANRILLIRHTYRPGWHFPGGGVEKGESAFEALGRELREEAGVELDGTPALFSIYENSQQFPGDHVALFLVRQWRQPDVPKPNMEIAEQRFVTLDALPSDLNSQTRVRIDEIFNGVAAADRW